MPTLAPLIIPTPPLDGEQISLLPVSTVSGWFANDETDPHYDDANLHAGTFQGKSLASVLQFNLRNLPADSKILYAALEMTGRDDSRIGTSGDWHIEILDNSQGTDWLTATSSDLAQAPAMGVLSTTLTTGDLPRDV